MIQSEQNNLPAPILVIVMGVSGCGKSSVAKRLAELNVFEFMEADEFHSESAISKMSQGVALNDRDREPWIESMCSYLKQRAQQKINCCLAYSGLKSAHRIRFKELGFETTFIHLSASKEVILKQLEGRNKHYMGSGLLDSQFNDLEPPTDTELIFKLNIESIIEKTVMSAQQLLLSQILNK